MKSVSDAYKASMNSLLRERSFIKIYFANIDSTAATDGEWQSNGEVDYSDLSTLDYSYDYGEMVASLELNRWVLNGAAAVLQEDESIDDGYISAVLSDENEEFSTAAILTRSFSNPHSFAGLTLTFDTREKVYPKEITVDFIKSGNVADEVVITPTGTKVFVPTSETDVEGVTITFNGLLPFHRPRIEMVLYGVEKEFTNDDVVSATQSHDVDPLTRRLPNEQFTFTILDYEHEYDPDNPQGIYKFIDINAPVTVSYGYELPDGTVEWLKPDKYLLNARPTAKNHQATFTATGLIGSMSEVFYKSQLGQKNFYDMAVEVLQDAHLTPTEHGDDPWEVDEALKQMFTTAVLPIDTHMNCLQLIAHACCCRLYTDDDNIIHIKPFGVTKSGIYKGEFSDNGHAWFSEWGTVDKGNSAATSYVTLELNRWILDGRPQVIIDNEPSGRGFASESLANDDGEYTTVPTFTRTFDVPHDLSTVALVFDTLMGDYPTSIQVDYYQGETLYDTKAVTSITSPEIFISNEVPDCTKIEVSALEGSPYQRFRVSKVFYRQTDFTLNFDSIKEKTQALSKTDLLKNVTVAKTIYIPDEEASDIYEETTTQTHLHIEFSGLATDINIVVEDGTLISSDVYGRAADLELSSGAKTVKITGTRLSESAVVVSFPAALTGETDKEENPLITNDETATALADHVKKYLQMRNTYDANYRGNPELETGDIIGLQTLYTDEMDALILVDEITFNGALSGKLKVKGLI